MAIDCKVEQERMELRLTGEIDHHRAGALMRELETQLDLESPRTVELDLGGVLWTPAASRSSCGSIGRWPSPAENSGWCGCLPSREKY